MFIISQYTGEPHWAPLDLRVRIIHNTNIRKFQLGRHLVLMATLIWGFRAQITTTTSKTKDNISVFIHNFRLPSKHKTPTLGASFF